MNPNEDQPSAAPSAPPGNSSRSLGPRLATLISGHKLTAGFLGALATATIGVIVPQLIHSAESAATSDHAPVSVQVISDLSRFRSGATHVPLFVIPDRPSSIGPPPNRYAANPGDPHVSSVSGDLDTARYDWAHSLGGLDAEETLVRLSISGTTTAATDLQQIRVKILRCTRPRRGTLVSYLGLGDSIGTRFFTITLDGVGHVSGREVPPGTVAYVGTGTTRRAGPEPFPLRVTDSIQEEFDITADAVGHDCQWELLLDWTQGSRTGTAMITNHGNPFETTAAYDAKGNPIRGVEGVSWDIKAQRWVRLPTA
jgi:hypothetical protein